jgi:hypothetical protein
MFDTGQETHREETSTLSSESDRPVRFTLVKSETLALTREFVRQFRRLERSPTERELNKSRLKNLRQKFLAGQIIPFCWATAEYNGVTLGVNGQHSSWVLDDLGDDEFEQVAKVAVVHLDHYKVEGGHGLPFLFRQFDDRRSSRSSADVAGAYQCSHDELRDLMRPLAKNAVDGVAWWRRNIEGTGAPDGDNVYDLFGESGLFEFIKWGNHLLTETKAGELKSPAVAAAMYATFIANKAAAQTFWHDVASGGADDKSAPATMLSRWLIEQKEPKRNRYFRMKPGNFYQACIHAWNAYREEKALMSIKSDTKKGMFIKVIG